MRVLLLVSAFVLYGCDMMELKTNFNTPYLPSEGEFLTKDEGFIALGLSREFNYFAWINIQSESDANVTDQWETWPDREVKIIKLPAGKYLIEKLTVELPIAERGAGKTQEETLQDEFWNGGRYRIKYLKKEVRFTVEAGKVNYIGEYLVERNRGRFNIKYLNSFEVFKKEYVRTASEDIQSFELINSGSKQK